MKKPLILERNLTVRGTLQVMVQDADGKWHATPEMLAADDTSSQVMVLMSKEGADCSGELKMVIRAYCGEEVYIRLHYTSPTGWRSWDFEVGLN